MLLITMLRGVRTSLIVEDIFNDGLKLYELNLDNEIFEEHFRGKRSSVAIGPGPDLIPDQTSRILLEVLLADPAHPRLCLETGTAAVIVYKHNDGAFHMLEPASTREVGSDPYVTGACIIAKTSRMSNVEFEKRIAWVREKLPSAVESSQTHFYKTISHLLLHGLRRDRGVTVVICQIDYTE